MKLHTVNLHTILIGLFIVAGLHLPAAAQHHKGDHNHRFTDADKWARVFDDPKREAWQKPHEVIQALKLNAGVVIADIGAGTGYFATRFARMIPQSRVYGVDAEPGMVKYLGDRAKKESLGNLTAVLGTSGDPRIPEKADLIILVDVYHHVEGRPRYFRELRQSLKPGGRIAIIDFRVDSPEGPARASRIAPERVIAEFKEAGYQLVETHDFLPRQYFLVFQNAG